MADHLRDQVAPARLLIDDASSDTFDSVVAAARLVHSGDYAGCTIVSDAYHVPRIALMFRILGVPAQAGPVASNKGGTPLRHWIWMRAREAVATPYDAVLTLIRRRRLLSGFRSA